MRRTSLRPRASSRRRPRPLAVLALLALLLTAALPAQAQTAGDPVLNVIVADGAAPVTIAWSQLAGQIDGDAKVQSGGRTLPPGLYLARALAIGGILPQTYSGVTSLDGVSLLATKADLLGDNLYLFLAEDGTLQLRFVEAGGDPIVERWVRSVNGVATIRLQRQPLLLATPEAVPDGGEVIFDASISSDLDPARVTYQWDFNDDSALQVTEEPTVRHVFRARNSQLTTRYSASVIFLVDGKRPPGAIPQFADVDVTLDKDKVDEGLGADAGNGPAHASRKGDRRGRRGGERARPESQPSTDGSGDGTSTGGSYDGGSYDGGSTSTPPAATPVTPPPAQPRQPKPRRAPEQRRAPVAEMPAGETVDGYLLASADVPLALAGGAAAAARTQTAAIRQPDDAPLQVPTAVWVAVGLLALVVLGWGLESRTTLPYFRP